MLILAIVALRCMSSPVQGYRLWAYSTVGAWVYALGHAESLDLLLSSRRVARAILAVRNFGLEYALWLFRQRTWHGCSLRPLCFPIGDSSGSEQTDDEPPPRRPPPH